MQLCHLTLERARHHPLAQALEAMHLGLHQTPAVVAAPLLPDKPTQPLARQHRFVAHHGPRCLGLPHLGVLARGDYRLRSTFHDRRMARFGVVCAVRADAGYRFTLRYLHQQSRQHGRIAHAVVCDLDGPYLQRAGIDAQVHFAPLAPVLSPVFLSLPFPFTQELDAGAVHQQSQRAGRASVGQLHLQCLLAAAHGAEVRHPPLQACQAQQALHQSQALAQGQAEEAFEAQAELDGGVAEHVLPAPLAAGGCVPLHVFVQPDGQ